jgi:hypothetical protein
MSDSTISLLGEATSSQIALEPYPHIVIQEALPADLYRRLEHTYPVSAILERGRALAVPGRYGYSAANVLQDEQIDSAWISFFDYHASAAFFQEVVSLFGPIIRQAHPNLESHLGRKLNELRTSIRPRKPRGDVALDVQFIYNSPSTVPARLAAPHLDRPVALYAGLFYLRLPGDDSMGGDLELWRFTSGRRLFHPDRQTVRAEVAERVKTIPYQPNTLVLFPHSVDSVHAVSERSPSLYPRLHVNLIAEFDEPFYDPEHPSVDT